MSKSLRDALLGIGLLIAMVVAIAWISGMFGNRIGPDEQSAPVASLPENVSKSPVTRVTEKASEWASGTLQSASRTAVSSRILARIEEIKVAAGDHVKSGDALVVLDARELKARAEQAGDAKRAAEAKRGLAQQEMERAEELLKRGVGTSKRHDEAVSSLGVARAEVDRATRGLEEAEAALSYAVIHSNVDGRVVDRLAEPGDTAAPGTPLLRIYDPSRLRVEAPVRESLAVQLSVGTQLDIVIPALDQRFEGVIEEIVPFAEPGARTLLVKVALPGDERLYSGMFARIAVPAGKRTRLYVPAAAVEQIGQLAFVNVLAADKTVSRRLITTGVADDEKRLEVLSGLKEGEIVLTPAAAMSGS